MAEMDREETKLHGWLINHLFHEYTKSSKDAKILVMEHLSRDGWRYLAMRKILTVAMPVRKG
jgi:hypothetical protein